MIWQAIEFMLHVPEITQTKTKMKHRSEINFPPMDNNIAKENGKEMVKK